MHKLGRIQFILTVGDAGGFEITEGKISLLNEFFL